MTAAYQAGKHTHSTYCAFAHLLAHWAGVSGRVLGELVWRFGVQELHEFLSNVTESRPGPYGPGAGSRLGTPLSDYIGQWLTDHADSVWRSWSPTYGSYCTPAAEAVLEGLFPQAHSEQFDDRYTEYVGDLVSKARTVQGYGHPAGSVLLSSSVFT